MTTRQTPDAVREADAAFRDQIIDLEWMGSHAAYTDALDALITEHRNTILAALDSRAGDAGTTSAAIAAGNDLPTDRYGMTVLDRMRDTAENATMPPEDREDLFALLDLAAAPKAASIPDDVREDIVCVRETVTEDQWERLWVSLHGLKCNPVMDEITLVMQEVVAILCAPKATPAPAVDAVPAGEVDLPEAARLALMYLETGHIECPQCGHEVPTKDLDAVWQIKDGLAALSHGEGRK